MAHTSLKDGVLSDSLSVEETRLGGFSFVYFGMLGEKGILMLPRALNLDRIFSDGHDGIALPRPQYQQLLAIVQNLEWDNDPDGIYTRLPAFQANVQQNIDQEKFEKEERLNKNSLANCPENLLEAVKDLLNDSLIMGNWHIAHEPKLRFISVWDGAEDLDWHWDGPSGADFFFLIYLNRHQGWVKGAGGQLQVGRRPLDGNYLHVDSRAVEELASYDPATRSLVCCNNQNPQFVHKVTPLSTSLERTVLMVGFDMARSSACNHKP